MNSFTLTAVGNLWKTPEAVAKGDTSRTRFCVIGTDYAGKDDTGAPREVVTTLWFTAFGPLAESLTRNARKGDQLIIEARVRSNNWVDKQGDKQYDYDFVVEGYRFGAPGKIKREEFEARRGAAGSEDSGGHSNGFDSEIPFVDDANDSPLVGLGSPVLASSQPHHSYVADSPTVQYIPDVDLSGHSNDDQAEDHRDVENAPSPAAALKTATRVVVKKKTDKTRGRRS